MYVTWPRFDLCVVTDDQASTMKPAKCNLGCTYYTRNAHTRRRPGLLVNHDVEDLILILHRSYKMPVVAPNLNYELSQL